MLKDPAGPAKDDPDVQAIIFTSEANVGKGVEFVDNERKTRGLNSLENVIIPLIEISNGVKISSSLI